MRRMSIRASHGWGGSGLAMALLGLSLAGSATAAGKGGLCLEPRLA